MRKEKTKLPGLVYLFCISLVFGMLVSLPRCFALVEALTVFWDTPYFALACFDAIIFFVEVLMYLAILALIALRRRAFLICFWIDYACRILTMAVILLLGGGLGSSWTALIWPTIWAFYFYRSLNAAAAFSPYRRPLLRRVPDAGIEGAQPGAAAVQDDAQRADLSTEEGAAQPPAEAEMRPESSQQRD